MFSCEFPRQMGKTSRSQRSTFPSFVRLWMAQTIVRQFCRQDVDATGNAQGEIGHWNANIWKIFYPLRSIPIHCQFTGKRWWQGWRIYSRSWIFVLLRGTIYLKILGVFHLKLSFPNYNFFLIRSVRWWLKVPVTFGTKKCKCHT